MWQYNWHRNHIKLSQIFFKLFIYLLSIFGSGEGGCAVLGLCGCKQTFFTCNKWRLFSSCSEWASHVVASLAVDYRLWSARAQYLWCMGFDAPWHVGSSQTRDRTCVPCIGKQILNYWTIREALFFFFFYYIKSLIQLILF